MATKIREIGEPDVPIAVKQLIVGTRIPCNIYIKENNQLKIFCNRNAIYTKISQDILIEKGISDAYIDNKDETDFEYYLSSNRSLNQNRAANDRAVFKEYAYRKEQYHQIDTALMEPGTEINFSLSVLDQFNIFPLVEASDNSPAVINGSMLNVVGDIIIKKSDMPRYSDYIAGLRRSAGLSGSDKLRIKSLAIKESSKIVLEGFLADPRSGEKMKEATSLVNDMIDCILENKEAIYMLLSMKGYDYYTYTHSVNVAALSISLGIASDMKREEIEKLGIGAMLHDIGKSTISHLILNKQGKLDDVEYQIMKSHVIEGWKIMSAHKTFPEESLSAVLQHHEKLSGKGYPYGLSSKELELLGKITAIADCYDALTTRRPYRVAYSPFTALLIISKETGDFDPALLTIFVKMLGTIK